MTQSMWVAVGYGIAYGSVAAYLVVLGRRWRSLRGKDERR